MKEFRVISQTGSAIVGPDISEVRRVVQKHFPSLWPAVEACLSTCATLLLKDNANPVTMIVMGPASSGKTTVTNMFAGAQFNDKPLCYRSDSFTAAAFVSHSAQLTKEQLEKIDLLPKIKDKVLVTPELAPIFRGDQDELVKRFSVLTRVLDGQGLKTDSGVHGDRGYEGDYVFAWIGATTPIEGQIWKVMAQLGSRLFFLLLDAGSFSSPKDILEDLVGSLHGEVPYTVKLQECKGVVGDYLTHLFARYGGPRQVEWDSSQNPIHVLEGIAQCAMLLAHMRTPYEPDSKPSHETAHRANTILYNLARGRALTYGRTQLNTDDVPMVAQVALSSMPRDRRTIWMALARQEGRPLTVQQVATVLEVSRHTAEDRMTEMEWLGCMVFDKPGNGKESTLRVRPEWTWFVTGQGAGLLLGTTWQNSGGESEAGTESSITNPENEKEKR
ncbi:MAG: hypothetical protein NDI90_11180 [Nitrospira sp. BO4]|nr:hypothetical protein [Nitrospira sp. BO4]